MKRLLLLFITSVLFYACQIESDPIIDSPQIPDKEEDAGQEDPDSTNTSGTPGAIVPFTTASLAHEGVSYIWDESVIPEITIQMSAPEWNKLLKRYDEFYNSSSG